MTSERRHQIVGVDGSPGSTHALAWAIARSEYLGPVQPVSSWNYPWWAFVPTASSTVLPLNEEEFDNLARGLVGESLAGLDHSDVLDTVIVHGAAGEALVSAATDASLIVVGTRGHGTLASGLLGSVSSYCARHAPVPVAVIPEDAPVEDRFGSVVVGYDGSAHSERAVEWTVANTPGQTEITLVHAWDPSDTVTAQTAAMTADQLSAESSAMLAEAVERFGAHPGAGDRRFTANSEAGDAREILRAMSQTCDALIVGARGRGGLSHLLLGSVSTALINQPTGATVVVH